jgi:hypothetical protein
MSLGESSLPYTHFWRKRYCHVISHISEYQPPEQILLLERLHICNYSRKFAAGWNSSDRSISSFVATLVPSYAYKDQRRTNLSLKGLANPTSPYSASYRPSYIARSFIIYLFDIELIAIVSVIHGIWNHKDRLSFCTLNSRMIRTGKDAV